MNPFLLDRLELVSPLAPERAMDALAGLLRDRFGGAYQLYPQLRAVAEGHATLGAVAEVLPGIAIMLGLMLFAAWIFRIRASSSVAVLLDVFRRVVRSDPADAAAAVARPIH